MIQANADNGVLGRAAYFALYTGCRSGELFALQYKDIDRKAKLLTISKSVYYVGTKPHIKQPKTSAGIRTVPLPQFLLDQIPDGPANDFIFSLTGREPISDNIRRNGWEKFQRETGISCTLHQLRHAYASLLYESGVDEKTAQKLMGHSDITTTLRIYTHLRDQHLKISQDIFRSFLDSK